MDLGDDKIEQILSKGYKHDYRFTTGRQALSAGGAGTPFQPQQGLSFNIGQESWWVWTKISVWATATTVGTGNPLESVQIAFRTISSGRDHQNDPLTPITLLGTIGYPYPIACRQFFNRATELRVFIRNLAAGTNTVEVVAHGFRFFPDPEAEAAMARAFANLTRQGLV